MLIGLIVCLFLVVGGAAGVCKVNRRRPPAASTVFLLCYIAGVGWTLFFGVALITGKLVGA